MLSLVDKAPPAPAEAGLEMMLVVVVVVVPAEVFMFFLEIYGDTEDEGAADG